MLPADWRPVVVKDLVRVGPNEDGGYVVPMAIIEKTEVLFGLGLSTNWKFEEDFRKRSNCRVICYDHTVDRAFWLRKVASDMVGFLAGRDRFRWSKIKYMFKFFEYRSFFKNPNVVHHQTKVGYDGNGSVSIQSIMKLIKNERAFFKIDIEGWEYRVMNDLLESSYNVLGLVIELHDVDLHRGRISSFIKKLTAFKLVHIHANNWAGMDAAGDPITVEMTFARSDLVDLLPDQQREWPIDKLDFPNNRSEPDIPLKFMSAG
jgi:hypothetical protein